MKIPTFEELQALGPVPSDLGGFQNIITGNVKLGDLLVRHEGVDQMREWAFGLVGGVIMSDGDCSGWRVYRRMKTPNHKDVASDETKAIMAGAIAADHPALTTVRLDEVTSTRPVFNFIPQDSERRKGAPMFRGLLAYFPGALFLIAEHSRKSNDKHNPGQDLHWSRDKSADHLDCCVRHIVDAGFVGTPNRLEELTANAWRACAALQEEAERHGFAPSPASRF